MPVPTPPEPAWGKRLAVAAVLVVIVAGAGAAYVYRDKLMALRPFQASTTARPIGPVARAPAPAAVSTTAPAEKAAESSSAPAPAPAAPKLDAPSGPAQLEVDLAASKIELVDGRYVVRGEIANHGGSAGSASKLVVTFKKGNDVLDTRTYPLTLGPIAPGDRQSFSQALDNPPAGATDIVPSVE